MNSQRERQPHKLNSLKFLSDNNSQLNKAVRIIYPPGAQNAKDNMKCDIETLKRSIQKSEILTK